MRYKRTIIGDESPFKTHLSYGWEVSMRIEELHRNVSSLQYALRRAGLWLAVSGSTGWIIEESPTGTAINVDMTVAGTLTEEINLGARVYRAKTLISGSSASWQTWTPEWCSMLLSSNLGYLRTRVATSMGERSMDHRLMIEAAYKKLGPEALKKIIDEHLCPTCKGLVRLSRHTKKRCEHCNTEGYIL